MHGGGSRNVEADDYVIVPPDGGWGWVIVFAAFYCQLIIDGIQLSFGMILKEIRDEYDVPYSSVSLIGSLMYGTHYLSGPLCAGLSYYFGDRPITMTGSILAFIGLAAPYFFELPIYALYLLVGILSGVGLCFVNMNSIIITALYFSKKRILVLGIVVCGTGAGTIVFSCVAHFVLRSMDWRTVCLVESLMALSMFVATYTFRPLKPVLVQTKDALKLNEVKIEEVVEDNLDNDFDAKPHRVFYVRELQSSETSREGSISSYKEEMELAIEDLATTMMYPFKRWPKKFFQNASTSNCQNLPPRRRIRNIITMSRKQKECVLHKKVEHGVRRISASRDDMKLMPKGWRAVWSHILLPMADCKILKSLSFLSFCIAVALSAAALVIVVYYEKVLLLSEGYEEDNILWYHVSLGASNMFWRLSLGAISTIPRVNFHSINIIGLILGGAATAASPISHSTTVIYMCGVMYGLATGCFAVFYPVILLELVGSEKISNATGISMMFMGVFSVIGAPLSGAIIDYTATVSTAFYIGGSMFIISGIIFLFITGRRRGRG